LHSHDQSGVCFQLAIHRTRKLEAYATHYYGTEFPNAPKVESSKLTKYWIRLLLLVGCVIGFIALIGSLLPRNYEFRSEIEIDAPASVVFAELNQLSTWQTWSHWNRSDLPGFSVEYSGPDAGVGATQVWTEPRGSGKLWFTVSEADAPQPRIEYESLFANFPTMAGVITLTPLESGSDQADETPSKSKTKIEWVNSGRLPAGPTYGFLAPFFSGHIQYVYDNSLNRLKEKLEDRVE